MKLLASAFAVLLAACALEPPSEAGRAAAALGQDERMAWWRDARFGMFVHWGLYAIPAGEWNGNKDHGEWIRTTAEIPLATYARFQPQWNPVNFDADAWALMAASAGMKYVVITSKHHDGFCLWDSSETDWDVGNTPNGRDILAELSAACRKHGIRFCTYHSIMDWHHPDYLPRRGWEQDRPTAGADFDRFERYLHAQVTEIVRRYRPAVMWFDGEWESTWNHERGLRLYELCRQLDPTMIVNNRVDVHRGGMQGFSDSNEAVGDFQTPEQEIPATGVPGVDWESCMTMNRHWGWNQADTQWKSTAVLLQNLIDIASKGGNYLLNIGPRADGTFPDQAVQRLAEIGTWMDRNGESIHGTTASVFDELPFGRCTVKAERDGSTTLYLHVFDYPAGGELVLPGLGSAVRCVSRLDRPDLRVTHERRGADVAVQLPATDLDPIATVVVVELKGPPIVYKAPVITTDADEFVTSITATASAGDGLTVRYTLDGSEPTGDSPATTGPITLTTAGTLKARTFHDGKAVSAITERTFTKVTPTPPTRALASGAGLRAAHLSHVDWDRIPDHWRGLPVDAWAMAPRVTVIDNPFGGKEHIALRLEGLLDVPADDLYRFALASDDGSKLWIDDQLVVDNDGLHGTVEKRGTRALAKGLHAITVVWFNKTGGAELKLRWARPGEPLVEVPMSALRH